MAFVEYWSWTVAMDVFCLLILMSSFIPFPFPHKYEARFYNAHIGALNHSAFVCNARRTEKTAN
jgi:hypothetical protein